jgi:chromosome transmission fidelity protein 18
MVLDDNKENIKRIVENAKSATLIKKDFFGRVVEAKPLAELDANSREKARREERKVWVTFHEGLNNAVRKPMSMRDFMRGL